MHLDHFQDPDLIDEAIGTAAGLGVTSIMIDAAHLPYRDNVQRTRRYARQWSDAGLRSRGRIGRNRRQGRCAHPRFPHQPG